MARQLEPHARALAYDGAIPSLSELVMGVHWSPSGHGGGGADLDALCVLYDAPGRVLDTIHPGRLRNANGSVVHTGDSLQGANHWDDERLFVFPEALPGTVARLTFVVACADGRTFDEVPGAVCHVTDHASEHEWLRLDLTALRGQRSHTVATLQRAGDGWSLAEGANGADRA